MPKVVPEYKELAKKKIIKAAYTLFEQKGFHSTSMDDIAHKIGVSKASIYSYFKSKEDILIITVDQALTDPFLNKFQNDATVEAFKDYYNTMAVFEGLLHLNFVLTALAHDNKDIKTKIMDTYETKLEVLSNFVSHQQKLGSVKSDLEPIIIAQFLIAVYNDLAMQLIIGVDETKISNSLNSSLNLILESRSVDKNQKTLTNYF